VRVYSEPNSSAASGTANSDVKMPIGRLITSVKNDSFSIMNSNIARIRSA